MVSGRVADGTFEGSFPENVVNIFAEGVAQVVVGGTFERWLPEDVANEFSERVADGAFEGASLEDIGTFEELLLEQVASASFGKPTWTIFTSEFASLWRQTGEECWARTLSMAQTYCPET